MKHYTNIKARYEWRVLQGDRLINPNDVTFGLGDDQKELNRNHLEQPFFTSRELAYQKLSHWLEGSEANEDFVLIEIVERDYRGY
jgi:hypothetical protein